MACSVTLLAMAFSGLEPCFLCDDVQLQPRNDKCWSDLLEPVELHYSFSELSLSAKCHNALLE